MAAGQSKATISQGTALRRWQTAPPTDTMIARGGLPIKPWVRCDNPVES